MKQNQDLAIILCAGSLLPDQPSRSSSRSRALPGERHTRTKARLEGGMVERMGKKGEEKSDAWLQYCRGRVVKGIQPPYTKPQASRRLHQDVALRLVASNCVLALYPFVPLTQYGVKKIMKITVFLFFNFNRLTFFFLALEVSYRVQWGSKFPYALSLLKKLNCLRKITY